MLFNLNNPYEVDKFTDYCEEQKKKGGIVEVRRKHRQRSLSQNSYLHLILGFFAAEFGYSLEEVKLDLFKKEVNKEIFIRERVNRRCDIVKYVRSSADLDTAEMTTAIERFRNYSASEAGLYLPAPNEYEALVYAQQLIDSYKEFE